MRWVLRRLCNVWCHAAQLMMCGCDRGSGWRNMFFGVVAGCGVWVGADLGLLGLMSQHTQKPFSSMCAMWQLTVCNTLHRGRRWHTRTAQ